MILDWPPSEHCSEREGRGGGWRGRGGEGGEKRGGEGGGGGREGREGRGGEGSREGDREGEGGFRQESSKLVSLVNSGLQYNVLSLAAPHIEATGVVNLLAIVKINVSPPKDVKQPIVVVSSASLSLVCTHSGS